MSQMHAPHSILVLRSWQPRVEIMFRKSRMIVVHVMSQHGDR
jgi:hypothetical protein